MHVVKMIWSSHSAVPRSSGACPQWKHCPHLSFTHTWLTAYKLGSIGNYLLSRALRSQNAAIWLALNNFSERVGMGNPRLHNPYTFLFGYSAWLFTLISSSRFEFNIVIVVCIILCIIYLGILGIRFLRDGKAVCLLLQRA